MFKNYYDQNQYNQYNYILDDMNRKLRNLNNRIRRLENYLGLRADDKFDEDLFYND